jgi:hypothetical protein
MCRANSSCRENQNILYFEYLFQKSRAFCEIMWKNMVEQDKPQMATSYGAKKIKFACQITKATPRVHTHSHTHTHTQNV